MQYLSCKRIRFKVNSNNAILIKKNEQSLVLPKDASFDCWGLVSDHFDK